MARRQILPRTRARDRHDCIGTARLALANRHYGYRRIAALLGREGWRVNHKRVLRVMPNLARGVEVTGLDQFWATDITYVHLTEEVDGSDYRDLADARIRIGEFIEGVYNRQRLHSALDY